MNSTLNNYKTPSTLHADFTQQVAIDCTALPWQESPQSGVLRRFLDRVGGEVARATSLVKYAPHSRFPSHTHGAGEEFLVLEGTFCDEHGRYPKGTYVRNPPGSSHAPFTQEGCIIFVKLRQMQNAGEPQVVRNISDLSWKPAQTVGQYRKMLFHNDVEQVCIERVDQDVLISDNMNGGAELLILSGELEIEGNRYHQGSWLRFPDGHRRTFHTTSDAEYWIKRGHLSQ